MIGRLDLIARRRALLVGEIAQERERTATAVDALRTQLAIAGAGLIVARLLRRSRWLRMLGISGAVIASALPWLARWIAQRR